MFQTGYIADHHRTKKTRGTTVVEKPRALNLSLTALGTQRYVKELLKGVHMPGYLILPDRYKTWELFEIAVWIWSFGLEYVLNQYKTQEMCEIPVGGWAFALKYVSHKCNTQKMSNEAVEEEHLLLEVVPDKYRPKWMYEKESWMHWNFFLISIKPKWKSCKGRTVVIGICSSWK